MKIRLTSWDRKWSELVRRRDNDTCQVCGNVGHVNAHHIITRSVKSLRFEPLNGLTLCFQCHTANHRFSAHKTPEAFIRWFKQRYSLRWELIKKRKRQMMSERDAVKEFEQLLNSNKD